MLSVDSAASTVELRERGTLSYDTLLLATGGVGRELAVPGEDAEGLTNFNTLPEADYVLERLKTAKRGLVIGGGLIGAEVAEAFHERGLPCTYLVREDFFYPIFCSESQSLIVQKRFEHFGINLLMGRGVDHFEVDGDNQVVAAVDSAGERHECDLVVRSIGINARVDFLEGSGIETGSGVTVDEHLRTNVPNVYAAGDCSAVRLPGVGRPLGQKLWYTSQPQGWVAGENMCGSDAAYDPGPIYQSAMFMDLDFTQYGEVPAPWNDLQDVSVDSPNGVDALWLVHDGTTIVGASFLGTSMTKEDVEAMVVDGWPLNRARESAERILGVKKKRDRAPKSRVDEKRSWSRRPRLWPKWLRKGAL